MTRPIGPIEPQKDVSKVPTPKSTLPTPNEFRLPDHLPTQESPTVKITFPAFELLDRAARLKDNPAQATFEVLGQGALPEGKSTEKMLQNQAGLFIAQALAKGLK